ncbi:MAG: hypothetical protein JWQ34_98 [Mucilaginibacter sp.]|nr:hypothetical protein [Mucilaginibacter sp.]
MPCDYTLHFLNPLLFRIFVLATAAFAGTQSLAIYRVSKSKILSHKTVNNNQSIDNQFLE